MSYLCIAFDMPLFGNYGEDFDEELRLYLERLLKPVAPQKLPSGTEVVQVPHRGMADFVRLSQSRSYENLSYCPNVIAYLKAMVLYVELHQLRQRLCIETGTVSKMLSNWKQRGYLVLDLASTPTNLDDEVYRKTEKYLKR